MPEQKKTKVTSYRYRDSETGRLVKKSTWKRSKSHGGKRYKREKINTKKRREYILIFSYKKKGKDSNGFKADVFVIGPKKSTLEKLLDICRDYLDEDWFIDAAEDIEKTNGDFTDEDETAELRSVEYE